MLVLDINVICYVCVRYTTYNAPPKLIMGFIPHMGNRHWYYCKYILDIDIYNHLNPLIILGDIATIHNSSIMETTVFTKQQSIADFKASQGITELNILCKKDGKPFFRTSKEDIGGRVSDNAYDFIQSGEVDKIEVAWFEPDEGEASWIIKSKNSIKSISI